MKSLNDRAGEPTGLVAAAQEQVRPLLAAFFRRRIAVSHKVDDLVQEVFLRLVRRGGFTEDDNIQAYAFGTAYSVLLDRSRYRCSRQGDRHVEHDADLHAGTDAAFEETLVAREMLNDAASALGELPERCRRVFILRRVDGLSMDEIERRIGDYSSAERSFKRAALHFVKSRTVAMTERKIQSTDEINDELTDWLLVHDRGLTAFQAREFDSWLSRSPAHSLAWSEVAPLWESFDRSHENEALAAMLEDARDPKNHRFFRPPVTWRSLSVTGGWIFILTLFLIVVSRDHRQQMDRQSIGQRDYATGDRSASYRLADGTRLTLDAGSALSVLVQGNTRMASLTRGRAYLDVHYDAARPFNIIAGEAGVTDEDPRSGYASQAGGLSVTLLSGKVAIMDPATGPTTVTLVPGQQFLPGSSR